MSIEKDMVLLDILEKYPETEDVFHMYDERAGVCIMCSHLFDSLESVTKKYGIELDEILNKLNRAINS